MHTAKDLCGHIDPMCFAIFDPFQRRSTGAVNAGQAKDSDVLAQRLPRKVSIGARGSAAFADSGALVDPRTARVAIYTR